VGYSPKLVTAYAMLRIQSVIAKVVNFKSLVTFCFIISMNLPLEENIE